MKGVILAGGLGLGFNGLTTITNKHLLPVYDRLMILYPVKTLVRAGIKDVMVVFGGPYAGEFLTVLRNGKDLGIDHLEYAYQESIQVRSHPIQSGIAHALSLAEDFADGQPVMVVLGDCVIEADLSASVEKFSKGARVFLKKFSGEPHYGIAVFDKSKKKIIAIEEKPDQPKSSHAVTGVYLYDNKVFDYIREIGPSEEGQLEITDVNNLYIKNHSLSFEDLPRSWFAIKSFADLLAASNYYSGTGKKKL